MIFRVLVVLVLPIVVAGCDTREFVGGDVSPSNGGCGYVERPYGSHAEDAIWEVTGDSDARIGEAGSCEAVRCLYVPAGQHVSVYFPRGREDQVTFKIELWAPDTMGACSP